MNTSVDGVGQPPGTRNAIRVAPSSRADVAILASGCNNQEAEDASMLDVRASPRDVRAAAVLTVDRGPCRQRDLVTDKRHTDRNTTQIAGRLMSAQLDVPCTILDLSATGARVQVQPGLFLPKLLSLRARELGTDRIVQVVWRNKTQIGVHFGR